MTINESVRLQVLREGPDLASEREWQTQAAYNLRCAEYIDARLNDMSNVQLLERISDAMQKCKIK
jgi:hypothetical protein